MGGDPGGDNPLLHVLHIRKTQMLGRGHIAQKRGPRSSSSSAANRGGNVIVPRGDISHYRPQHIKRCAMTESLLDFHVRGDLIQRHMSGALHHNLNRFFPRSFRQFSQSDQFFYLGGIRSIRETAGTAGIPQTQSHVIFPADFQYFIEEFVKRIFLPRHFHPGKYDGTASGNNICQPFVLLELMCCFPINAAMDCHEVHSVLRMHPDNIDPFPGGNLLQRLMIINHRVINGNRTDHGRTILRKVPSKLPGIPEGTQIHNGLRPHFHSPVYLFILHLQICHVSGGSQIHVDFSLQHRTKSVRFQRFVPLIAGNDYLSFRHKAYKLCCRNFFFCRNGIHFFGENPPACSFHLCCIIHPYSFFPVRGLVCRECLCISARKPSAALPGRTPFIRKKTEHTHIGILRR